MKKTLKSALVLSGVLLMANTLTVTSAHADATEEAKNAAQRAVSSAISTVISDTVLDMQEVGGTAKTTLFVTPLYNTMNIEGSGFDVDVDMIQLMAGAIIPMNDTLYVSASLSYTTADVDGESIDLDIIMADVALIKVFSTGDLKTWLDVGVNYGQVDVGSDDIKIYGARVGFTAETAVGTDLSLQGVVGLSVGDSDSSGSEAAYAAKLGVKLAYKGSESFEPYFGLQYDHGFSTESGSDDTQTISVGPGVDFTLNDAMTLGVAYTYTTLIGNDDIDLDGHSISANFRMQF